MNDLLAPRLLRLVLLERRVEDLKARIAVLENRNPSDAVEDLAGVGFGGFGFRVELEDPLEARHRDVAERARETLAADTNTNDNDEGD